MSTPGEVSEPERTPTLSFDKQADPTEPDDLVQDVVEPVDEEQTDVVDPTGEQSAPPERPTRQPEPAIAVQRPIRMRTVVAGLVLLVIAGSVLVNQLTDVTVDAGAVFLALMIGGGILLIVGAAPRLGRARRVS